MNAVARALPALAERLPIVPLGSWPTPTHRLPRLGARLGLDLWIKRDDLSDETYGGNKVRKLELLLGAARHASAEALITVGGFGSNHVIATAIHGARALSLSTRAIVAPQPPTPDAVTNLRLAWRLGVTLVPCAHRATIPLALLRTRRREPRAFVIGPGGSSPLGTLAHVAAALELRHQIDAGVLPEPDTIVVALGSGGTAVGLALGLVAAGLSSRLLAVRVVDRPLCNASLLRVLAARTHHLLTHHGLGRATRDALALRHVDIDHDHAGATYGATTPTALAAQRLARDLEGIPLETTYTAKALAALIARARQPGRAARVLFWNTHASQDLTTLVSDDTNAPTPLPPTIQAWLPQSAATG